MKKIVAIVGMCGSGKSIATDFFVEKGYERVYFGGVVLEKVKESNLEITEENEKMVREKLRKDFGMAAMAIVSLPKIKKLSKKNNVVIDGLYSWEEYLALKEELGDLKVIAIVTDKKLRYSRLAIREVRPLTNEQAQSRDLGEIENMSKAPPIAYADYYVLNNGTIEDYKVRIEEIMKEI